MKEIRAIELFSGAGLLSEGFGRAGFSTIFAAEADQRAVASFNANIANVAEVWDVSQVKAGIECDLIVAGPPCQGFSTLGKRQVHDERNKLSLHVIDWAISTNAKVIVIENVPQFLKSPYWSEVKDAFFKLGYDSTEWVLNAADFGAAQNRTRAFAILSKIGLPKKPEQTVIKPITVQEALSGISIELGGEDPMHIAPTPSTLAKKRMACIPAKGDKRDILRKDPSICPPSWIKMGNQAVDVWGRIDYKKPANTIRCSFQNPSKGRYLHPIANRVISLREGARLQGVPDSWVFYGDRTSIARQIGNGVPVPLAEAVAKSIAKLFSQNSRQIH